MKTKEECNARRRDLRAQTEYAACERMLQTLVYAFEKAQAQAKSLKWLIQQRSNNVLTCRDYKKLPFHRKQYLTGVWDTLWVLHYKRLTFCYRNPETGAWTPADEALKDRSGLVVGRWDRDHCHKLADGTYKPHGDFAPEE